MSTTRTWQDNAEEFGALTKQGVDVRLAVLVACSVYQTDNPGGRPSESHREAMGTAGKVTIVAFAEKAETTDRRVSRHLIAWDKCAEKGWCKPSADLTPDDVNTDGAPTQEQFASMFDATASGSRPRDSKPEHAVQIIEKRGATEVVATMTPEVRESVAAALVEQMTPQQRESVVMTVAQVDRNERDLETIARGGTPPNREALTRPADPSVLDILGDSARARVKAEAALKAVIPALREVGGIPNDSPLADLIRITAMEMMDLIVVSTEVTP